MILGQESVRPSKFIFGSFKYMVPHDVHMGCVSLFSGGGFGDIGVEYGANVPILLCCELLDERASVLRRLFPSASVHCGNIWNIRETIISDVTRITNGKRPWLLVMSPPCQGMSSNGVGRIGNAMKKGLRPKVDARNSLVLPGLDIVEALQPEYVVIENVKHMLHTSIANEFDLPENIIDIVSRKLPNYSVTPKILDAASFGVPQRRERLITICRRMPGDDAPSLHPSPTHPPNRQVTIMQATAHLRPLDACSKLVDDLDSVHCIPSWSEMQHFCMRHTPEGETAFHNNRCPRCDAVAPTDVVRCLECKDLLPRPIRITYEWQCMHCAEWTSSKRSLCPNDHKRTHETVVCRERIVRAFKTSYRRMRGDKPASTLTTNSGVISSDVKGHPSQNRVLSVREVLIAASLASYPGICIPWDAACRIIESLPPRVARHIAGESIPPLVMRHIVTHLKCISNCNHQ